MLLWLLPLAPDCRARKPAPRALLRSAACSAPRIVGRPRLAAHQLFASSDPAPARPGHTPARDPAKRGALILRQTTSAAWLALGPRKRARQSNPDRAGGLPSARPLRRPDRRAPFAGVPPGANTGPRGFLPPFAPRLALDRAHRSFAAGSRCRASCLPTRRVSNSVVRGSSGQGASGGSRPVATIASCAAAGRFSRCRTRAFSSPAALRVLECVDALSSAVSACSH